MILANPVVTYKPIQLFSLSLFHTHTHTHKLLCFKKLHCHMSQFDWPMSCDIMSLKCNPLMVSKCLYALGNHASMLKLL